MADYSESHTYDSRTRRALKINISRLWWSIPRAPIASFLRLQDKAAAGPRCRSFWPPFFLFWRQKRETADERRGQQISEARYFPCPCHVSASHVEKRRHLGVKLPSKGPVGCRSLFNPVYIPLRAAAISLSPSLSPSVLPRFSRAWAKSRGFLHLLPELGLIFFMGQCGLWAHLNSAEICRGA